VEERVNKFSLWIILGILLLAVPMAVVAQHSFSVKQYEEFHDVLHPLEHEALPKNDFGRIRKQSAMLIKHGREIVKVGVPDGTAADKQAEFKKELAKFNSALNKFRTHARRGSDSQLKASYSAVHDSFEMLAAMLPRN
jgi:hypothetical protein